MTQMDVNGHMTNQFIFTEITKANQFSSDGESLYFWSGQYWQRVEKADERVLIRSCFTANTQAAISTGRIKEIIALIKECPELQMKMADMDTGIIQFQNGTFHVTQQILQEKQNKEKEKVAVVKANYIPQTKIEDSQCFLEFCKSSLDYNGNPEKTKLLLQIIGYSLSGYRKAKKAFFLIGAPSSGKSVLLHWIKEVMPKEDITQIPFGNLGNRFCLGQLRNARLNICAELAENCFPDIQTFKEIVSGDDLSGENKGEDMFKFKPQVTLLNAGNVLALPKNADGTLSVVDRMVLLLFNHSVPQEQWDTELLEKLIDEKNIICSLAVDTLKELVNSNFQFTNPDDSRVYLSNYRDAMDSVNTFVREECQLGEDYTVLSVELWNKYKNYCTDNMFQISISQQVFVNKIVNMSGVEKERRRIDGRQQTIFRGIKYGKMEKKERKEDEIFEPRLGSGGQSVMTEKHLAHPVRKPVVFQSNSGRTVK